VSGKVGRQLVPAAIHSEVHESIQRVVSRREVRYRRPFVRELASFYLPLAQLVRLALWFDCWRARRPHLLSHGALHLS
jgi:hypothetical protein